MKDDREIIKRIVPPADEVRVYALADLHLGSPLCDERGWLKFRDKILTDPNAYIILAGDLINNNTRGSVGSPFSDVMRPREQKRVVAEQLRPLAEGGRILCAVSGNHERRSLKDADDDPMYDVMCKLDLEDLYRENVAFLHLCIGMRKNGNRSSPRTAYNIAVAHGAGGGTMTGASVNKNEKYASNIENVDVLITGHSHVGAATKPAKILFDPTKRNVQIRPYICLSACSWQAYGGYAMQSMMTPRTTADATTAQTLLLCGQRDKKCARILW